MTKKNVQMHMVARNTAKLLELRASQLGVKENYGEQIKYHKVFLATDNSENVYFVDPLTERHWHKYVNNMGKLYSTSTKIDLSSGKERAYMARYTEIYEKPCALAHFSYSDSECDAMLLDLQGGGYTFTDPEIPTAQTRSS